MLYANRTSVNALPAHISDRLQPFDLSIFSPMKTCAGKTVRYIAIRQWNSHPNQVSRTDIDGQESIKTGYVTSVTYENIDSWFHNSGLYPFDATESCINSFVQHTGAKRLSLQIAFMKRFELDICTFILMGNDSLTKLKRRHVDTENGQELKK